MGFSINNLLNEATLSQQKKIDIKKIHYSKLIPNENNYFSMKDIVVLADDVEDNGLLQNLVIKENGNGTYTIVVGHRRHAAIKLLVEERGLKKFEEINCLIISQDEDELLTEYKLITSNLTHRGGFTALEISDKLKTVEKLTEIFRKFKQRGYGIKGSLKNLVSEILDISPRQTQTYQSILQTSEEIKNAVSEKKISLEDASKNFGAVTALKDNLENGAVTAPKNKELEYWHRNFRDNLETKTNARVKITNNKVTISFNSKEELKRIAQALDIRIVW